MKIQFKKIKLAPEIAEQIGEILTATFTVSDVNAKPGVDDVNVSLDYDNLSSGNKLIVDNFINLLKNS